jgi:myo-inositol-1-phosphate synthase
MKKSPIRVALIGTGNCAASLVQGLNYYAEQSMTEGLLHPELGGYRPADIEIVAAWDIDRRKVGRPLEEALYQPPNCAKPIVQKLPPSGVTVAMGRILDGIAKHMDTAAANKRFELADAPEAQLDELVDQLKKSKAQLLVNYLPVGSQKATEFYMEAALKAGVGVINCIPVFIASDSAWAKRFEEAGLPILGDDVKAQLGATVLHRTLADLFRMRGVELDETYQLNVGGNTDFYNMLDRDRLSSKKISKTEAVQSALERPLEDDRIHVGPSDFVPWLDDKKVCFLRMQGKLFGGAPMNIEVRLEVEDSPNSAGIVIDAIRFGRLALDSGKKGALEAPSAWLFKHPPCQQPDRQSYENLETMIDDFS